MLDFDEDTITGEVLIHGCFSFGGRILGDLVMPTGHAKSKCSRSEGRSICEANEVWHFSDGLPMKTSRIQEAGTFPSDIVGAIYDNPGQD